MQRHTTRRVVVGQREHPQTASNKSCEGPDDEGQNLQGDKRISRELTTDAYLTLDAAGTQLSVRTRLDLKLKPAMVGGQSIITTAKRAEREIAAMGTEGEDIGGG